VQHVTSKRVCSPVRSLQSSTNLHTGQSLPGDIVEIPGYRALTLMHLAITRRTASVRHSMVGNDHLSRPIRAAWPRSSASISWYGSGLGLPKNTTAGSGLPVTCAQAAPRRVDICTVRQASRKS